MTALDRMHAIPYLEWTAYLVIALIACAAIGFAILAFTALLDQLGIIDLYGPKKPRR